ncbi:MAG: riboflavin synthase [Pyrinomonadaceae bacterium]|nr:riboflavin synthase [Pyrinomonadaceae bacterium]
MFTGIIEELGIVSELETLPNGARIKISATDVVNGTSEGDSISVNGVCLTALDVSPESFSADVSGETLDKSTIGSLVEGSKVNLERAVTPSTRLGGHIVQGHVDATGEFLGASEEGDFWTVSIGFPTEVGKYLIYKGSISVEGISLTIAKLSRDHFEIAVIPKTWSLTNLSSLKKGDKVNLEVDVIAKYIERIVSYGEKDSSAETITLEKLEKLGFA